jgi:hypothetical protein
MDKVHKLRDSQTSSVLKLIRFHGFHTKYSYMELSYKERTEYRIENTRYLCRHTPAHISTCARICNIRLSTSMFTIFTNDQPRVCNLYFMYNVSLQCATRTRIQISKPLHILWTYSESGPCVALPSQLRRFGFCPWSDRAGSAVEALAMGRTFSKYFGFPFQFTFEHLIFVAHYTVSMRTLLNAQLNGGRLVTSKFFFRLSYHSKYEIALYRENCLSQRSE